LRCRFHCIADRFLEGDTTIFSTWFFGKRKLGFNSPRRTQARRPKAHIRPQLEILENRLAPATLTVINTNDDYDFTPATSTTGATGSFRGCWYNSHNGDTIAFDQTIFSTAKTILIDATKPSLFIGGGASLTITGPTALVTIDAGGKGGNGEPLFGGGPTPVFLVYRQATLTISNLTIANANTWVPSQVGISDFENGGAIVVYSGSGGGSTLNLTNVTFSNNTGSDGGAIASLGGNIVNLTRCIFTNNQALNTAPWSLVSAVGAGTTGAGGALYAWRSALTIKDCMFTNNNAVGGQAVPQGQDAGGGGAIDVDGGSLTISNSTFTGNTSGTSGGAIYSSNCPVTITGGTYSQNTAATSGGAIWSTGNVTITGNTGITLNVAFNSGGGIYVDPASLTIISSTVSGNSAPVGADIYNLNSAVILINSSVTNIFNNGGTITTPDSVATSLNAQISALLQSGALTADQAAGLTDKLQAATQSLDSGNLKAGVNELNAFINQLDAFVNSGTLTAAQAQPLIDGANQLINALISAGV
jgi:predicted outer membrane repeat protein